MCVGGVGATDSFISSSGTGVGWRQTLGSQGNCLMGISEWTVSFQASPLALKAQPCSGRKITFSTLVTIQTINKKVYQI